ncbi:hypothetical protein D9M71_413700 [compost metagenome]
MPLAAPVAALGIDRRRRQAQPLQQGMDTDAGDCQHADFAEGIEAAEVHQDDVDHVGATAARHAVVEEEAGDALVGAGQHGEGQQADHSPTGGGEDEVAEAAQAARLAGGRRRQVVERQHQQDDGDHFHRQLGQRQVGRREARKGQRHQQADHTEHHQRDHTPAV